MKVVGILTLWALLCGSVLFSNICNADVHGFELTPWQDCTDKAVCKVVKPKKWKAEEASALTTMLSELASGGLVHVMNKIQGAGYLSFERLKNSFKVVQVSSGPRVEKNLDTVAFTRVGNTHRTIAFTDRYFSEGEDIDPYTNVKMIKILLLHEMAHAYDHDFKLAYSPEFLSLAGFNNQNQFVKGSRESLNEGNIKYIGAQVGLKNPTKAMRFQREYGMKAGLPRIYSTTKPTEAFADLVAFIYYDPAASSYLDANLIRFMDVNVLKGQRAK